jgi:hypothetical protein
MSNLIPANSRSLNRTETRTLSRALNVVSHNCDVGLARTDAEAELQGARMMAVSYVGGRALEQVALVTQMEQQLATLVPLATSRLQAVGDMVALMAAEVVADTVRRIR